MPQIKTITVTPVEVEKTIEQIRTELFGENGNHDEYKVLRAFRAQMPDGAELTDEERNEINISHLNNSVIEHLPPFMQELGYEVSRIRCFCGEEITRDIDGYVELACENANPHQNHRLTFMANGTLWEIDLVEFSYETDDKTQYTIYRIKRDGAKVVDVDVEEPINNQDWDTVIRLCKEQLPELGFDGRRVEKPWYCSSSYSEWIATVVSLLVKSIDER